jgi:hypothetical protein
MAGMPGTGLGGIFYVLLIVWIVIKEGFRSLRGQGEKARWFVALRFAGLAAAIVAALWFEGWVIREIVVRLPFGDASGSLAARALAVAALTPAVALVPFFALGSLLLLVNSMRFFVRRPSLEAPVPVMGPILAVQSP